MGNVNAGNVGQGGNANPAGNANPGNAFLEDIEALNANADNDDVAAVDQLRPTLLDRVASEKVHACVYALLEHSKRKQRRFVETVEITIVLKDWASLKKRRIKGSYTFKHIPKTKFRVCVLGDKLHCDEAKASGIDSMDRNAIDRLQKSSKLVKKLATKYNGFLASPSLCNKIPRIMGPWLHRVGKDPILVTHNENLVSKVNEVKRTIRFEMNKSPVVGFVVGHVRLSLNQLIENFEGLVNYILTVLPNGWDDIRSLDIKSSMGPSQRVYY